MDQAGEGEDRSRPSGEKDLGNPQASPQDELSGAILALDQIARLNPKLLHPISRHHIWWPAFIGTKDFQIERNRQLIEELKLGDKSPFSHKWNPKSPATFTAVMGQEGLDYASPEEKYRLKSLPGVAMSGLHLMCLMYAGFKQVAPDLDPGMDLEKEYRQALLLRGKKK